MKQETWRRIDECVADALEMPAGERIAFVKRALADDLDALDEALGLVGEAETAEDLFAKGPMAELIGLEAGARLGPWELVKPLGAGGMGVVWLARRVDGETSMMAAIKMIPPVLSGALWGDQDLQRRFLNEKMILARLQHPNIARLLDARAGAGDTPNFVMEYVEGVPLMEYARRKGVDKLGLFLKICDAVSYAHANLVVHRDLKPQNVLVDRNGEPKLLDFGIGKILNDAEGDGAVTLRRAFSLDYASPEQIRGGMISTQTDVYSLGLLLYELVTGERARRWNDKGLGEVLEESEKFVLPKRDGLSADLLAVMRKATDVSVGRRYGAVAELRAEVERVLEGMPVEAREAGWMYPALCFAQRHWLAVSISVIGLALIVGLGIYGWVGEVRAEEKSRELEVVLRAEQEGRRAVELQRELARKMEGLAASREVQAEERLKDLLGVFGSVVASARWDISMLPGGIAASVKLLEEALGKIEAMTVSDGTRQNYMRLRAEAHGQLAEMYTELERSGLSEGKWRMHREKALELRKALYQMAPQDLVREQALEDQRFLLALPDLPRDLESRRPEWDAFEKRFLGLKKRGGKDPELARIVGSFYFRRGMYSLPKNAGRKADFETALRYFEECRKDLTTMRNVALTHKYLAAIVKGEDRLIHAVEALRLDRLRVERAPNDARAKLDLGFSIVSVADVHYSSRRNREAQVGYREGYELRKQLANLDPGNKQLLGALVYPARLYGLASFRLGDMKALTEAANEMSWVVERVQSATKDYDMASMNYWKGIVAGDGPEGCEYFNEAMRLLEGEKQNGWIHAVADLKEKLKGCAGR
jgi:hypothetical protein